MAERPIAQDCKSCARKGYAGSNPAPSTKFSVSAGNFVLVEADRALRFDIVEHYRNNDFDS